MAEELIELGKRGTSMARLRVCFRVEKAGKSFVVATVDRKTGKRRDYLGVGKANCLRVKSKKKALKIPTKEAAEEYAKNCGLRCRIR